ncbi:hypothetical protein SB6411_01002 [Klebsiella spallanzanii]|uniref:Class I SAM-dependent methyltransferase n=1 Tax=Klebsiella spallanzanii TaxID=2587528 RepID=A0ABY6VDB0_9ENTR|nr:MULTISPECIES: hypothetical protein [Enterobacteriaceae]GJL33386.1 hypothetical protein TUM17576_02060 [Enterobacter hormaechei]VUS46524.1 hypothetical protein SB6411_01002 [Klebsiella spallanzanii]
MTKGFLEAKIKYVLDDFENERWCDLNSKGFNNKNYLSKVNQQKYILKYYGAYFCELYELYEMFFNDFEGKEIKIMSIGCGSGVDCEALNRVCIDLNKDINKSYLGIDLVDWNYRPVFPWARFNTMNAGNIDSSHVKDIDLFVFPKSLTELSEDIRINIANTIASESEKDCIYFLNTYVTNCPTESIYVDGITQFNTISKILTKDGLWCCTSSPNRYFYKKDEGFLGSSYDFFKFPNEMYQFVSELKDSCNNHNNSPECMSCEINFYPILNSKYLAFNLLKYTKG